MVPFMGFIAFVETENFNVMANSASLSFGTRWLFDEETCRRVFGPFHAEWITRFTVRSFQIGLRRSIQSTLTIIRFYATNELQLTPASWRASLAVWYHLEQHWQGRFPWPFCIP